LALRPTANTTLLSLSCAVHIGVGFANGEFSECIECKQYELVLYCALDRSDRKFRFSRRVAPSHKAATCESVAILSRVTLTCNLAFTPFPLTSWIAVSSPFSRPLPPQLLSLTLFLPISGLTTSAIRLVSVGVFSTWIEPGVFKCSRSRGSNLGGNAVTQHNDWPLYSHDLLLAMCMVLPRGMHRPPQRSVEMLHGV
jgi:hypothetical protein